MRSGSSSDGLRLSMLLSELPCLGFCDGWTRRSSSGQLLIMSAHSRELRHYLWIYYSSQFLLVHDLPYCWNSFVTQLKFHGEVIDINCCVLYCNPIYYCSNHSADSCCSMLFSSTPYISPALNADSVACSFLWDRRFIPIVCFSGISCSSDWQELSASILMDWLWLNE